MTECNEKSFKGKKALVVDDDIDILTQLKTHLGEMGFEVTTCESQAEAEKTMEGHEFDLAVVDLMLEFMDSGFILGYKLKKQNPGIPVIIITSVSTETGIQFDVSNEEYRSWAKADAILDKEIRFEQLEREIYRLIA